MQWFIRLKLIILMAICYLSAQSGSALACASCGSGSDDPLILWPSEQFKTYLGFSTSNRFEAVDPEGKRGRESGPTSRDSLTMAIGKALRNDLFFTLTLPLQQNRLGSNSLRSVGDPMLAARWSWLVPDFTEPFVPQVQLMGSYKFANSRALQESDRSDLLDAFGTGIPETKLGIDTFWGQNFVKGGFALAGLFPEERKLGRFTVFPGNGVRTTATLGIALRDNDKILVGLVNEIRERRRNDGVRVEGSEVLSNAIFLTLDWSPAQHHTIRFSLTDKGRVFQNKNMIAASSASVAWLATWQ